MARPHTIEARFDFRSGVNRSFSSDVLTPTELRRARNTRLVPYGAVVKRGGSQRLHTSALATGAQVTGLYQWDAPGTSGQVVAVAGGNFYYKAAADADFTQIASTLSTSRRARFATHRAGTNIVLYFADGALRKWDGTTLTTSITGAPAATDIAVYKSRMFAVDGSKTVYWSAIGDPSKWSSADGGGFADVETYDTEGLQGIMSLGSSLLLFKEDNVARLTGTSRDDIQVDKETEGVSPEIGLIAPATLVRVEQVAFFLSDRGPYIADEAGVRFIGQNIELEVENANRQHLSGAVAVHNRRRREIWLMFPGSGETQNATVWVYNYRNGAWSGPWDFQGFACSVVARYERTDSTESAMAGGYDGFVRDLDVSSVGAKDDVLRDGTGGTAVPMEIELPHLIMGDPARVKTLRGVHSLAADLGAAGSASVEWSSEAGSNSASPLTIASQGAGERDYKFRLAAAGRRIALNIKEATTEIAQLNGIRLSVGFHGPNV